MQVRILVIGISMLNKFWSRLEQVLWLLLGVNAKGRPWLKKRNEYKGKSLGGKRIDNPFLAL
jgi:hypothetical protein